MQTASLKIYCFEGYTLDLRRGCLRKADREVDLRPKSFEVLRHLVEKAGRLVSKDEIVKTVWPDVIVTDESLTRCVSEVRLALGDVEQRIIKTVPRRGYLFAVTVSRRKNGAGSVAPTAEAFSPAPPLSIVVLPFVNLNGDPPQDYIADVITEELTSSLSRILGSFVIARSTAFTYKRRGVDVKQVGKDLGVRYVLEGSEQHTGARVRMNVQLIDTETGAHVWADQFDSDRNDLLRTQDEVVQVTAPFSAAYRSAAIATCERCSFRRRGWCWSSARAGSASASITGSRPRRSGCTATCWPSRSPTNWRASPGAFWRRAEASKSAGSPRRTARPPRREGQEQPMT